MILCILGFCILKGDIIDMATKQNLAKLARKKQQQAELIKKQATIISEINDDGSRRGIAFDGTIIPEAIQTVAEANGMNKSIEILLEKDSKKKSEFNKNIQENNNFLKDAIQALS